MKHLFISQFNFSTSQLSRSRFLFKRERERDSAKMPDKEDHDEVVEDFLCIKYAYTFYSHLFINFFLLCFTDEKKYLWHEK